MFWTAISLVQYADMGFLDFFYRRKFLVAI